MEAALAAFEGYREVVDRAQAEPGAKDWTEDIRRFSGDPEAGGMIQTVKLMKEHGIAVITPATWAVKRISPAADASVTLVYCMDPSDREIQYEDGEPVEQDMRPAEIEVTMTDFGPPYGWLVHVSGESQAVTAC